MTKYRYEIVFEVPDGTDPDSVRALAAAAFVQIEDPDEVETTIIIDTLEVADGRKWREL